MAEQQDRTAIVHFVAHEIKKGAPIDVQELAEAVSEVELETQTIGASMLRVRIADPYNRIAGSGFFDLIATNPITVAKVTTQLRERLPAVTVEFPEGTGWKWQLVNLELTNDLTQPNLILTFEDIIAVQLRERWGFKNVTTGIQTRAEFVYSLVVEANQYLHREGKPPIRFVCPSIGVLQEVEESTEEKFETATGRNALGELGGSTTKAPSTQEVLARGESSGETIALPTSAIERINKSRFLKAVGITIPDKTQEKTKVNKAPGISAAAERELTVKGQPITPEQRSLAEMLLTVGERLKAPLAARQAIIYAAIGESNITANPQGNLAGNGERYWGILSGSQQHFPNGTRENEKMAEEFYLGGLGFSAGGAIHLANSGKNDPAEIAVLVEVPSIWPENAYEQEEIAEGLQKGTFLRETEAIIVAWGGARGSLLFGSGSTLGESDVPQLMRGSPTNPDESSWEAIQRLAAQVRWYAFTNGLRIEDYEKGRFLYYMDAFDFIRQKPSATIHLFPNLLVDGHTGRVTPGAVLEGFVGNIDNTTYEYYSKHKVQGNLQLTRSGSTTKPSTPSEIRLPLLCAIDDYEAGDVFEFKSAGAFNGRWIVTDALRNCIRDPYTTFTLAPPLLPYPEPFASTSAIGASFVGLQAVAQIAERALNNAAKYVYKYGAGHGDKGEPIPTLFQAEAPIYLDCSSFAELCYREAGLPDPAGHNYTPFLGATTEMIANMVRTSNPQPGDLIFYGTDEKAPKHVVVYTGNGNGIGMEAPGVNLLSGPVWGPNNLGGGPESKGGAGPPIGGENHAYRLRGGYSSEVHRRG